jgi:hypothetical protein
MKKCFLVLLNKVFKKDLELVYGIGSKVEIRDVIYSTNKKIYVISCVLIIGDTILYEEIGETGLNYLFEESWKMMGFHDKKFMLQTSFELT